MGVAKGGSWGSWDPPNPPVIILYHGRGGVQYSIVSSVVRRTPFMLLRYGVLQGHGLSVEYRRGQLTTSLVLGFKFLVLALDCQSLAFALGSKSLVLALALGYQSLALASALDCQSFALSLEVVLDIALNIQIFWQPTQHWLAFSQVSRSNLGFHS